MQLNSSQELFSGLPRIHPDPQSEKHKLTALGLRGRNCLIISHHCKRFVFIAGKRPSLTDSTLWTCQTSGVSTSCAKTRPPQESCSAQPPPLAKTAPRESVPLVVFGV